MASYIISKRLNDKKGDTEDETESIIKAAADLIKSEIREMKYDSEYYPTCQDVVDRNWIPKSLVKFLSMFKLSDLRQESIGQCIANGTSQKIMPPILLALGVGLDHIYGSKWLIDELFRLGFTVSYTEVTKYKQACSQVPIDQQIISLCPEEIFTQFVADNTDHNIRTLDGKETFHGMRDNCCSHQIEGKYCRGN